MLYKRMVRHSVKMARVRNGVDNTAPSMAATARFYMRTPRLTYRRQHRPLRRRQVRLEQGLQRDGEELTADPFRVHGRQSCRTSKRGTRCLKER